MSLLRLGNCTHCGECCRPDPSIGGNPLFTEDELAATDRVDGYCPLFRWKEDVGHCLGHGTHPFYLGGCHLHPTQPADLVETPNCTYTFVEVV